MIDHNNSTRSSGSSSSGSSLFFVFVMALKPIKIELGIIIVVARSTARSAQRSEEESMSFCAYIM